MSEPAPEYDLGKPADVKQMAAEPGVPDELVEQMSQEPAEVVGFNSELAAEASPLLISAVLAIVLTEAIKPWVKIAAAKYKLTDDVLKRVVQTLPFIFGAVTAQTFGFRAMVIDLTGVSLSMAESGVYGGASVGVVALVIYEFIHSIRPIKVLRLRFYKFVGVTEDEVQAPTVRKHPPIDPGSDNG